MNKFVTNLNLVYMCYEINKEYQQKKNKKTTKKKKKKKKKKTLYLKSIVMSL